MKFYKLKPGRYRITKASPNAPAAWIREDEIKAVYFVDGKLMGQLRLVSEGAHHSDHAADAELAACRVELDFVADEANATLHPISVNSLGEAIDAVLNPGFGQRTIRRPE